MTGLILNPDDGRETCVDQPIRKFDPTSIAPLGPDPLSQFFNNEVRRVTDDYYAKLRAKAEELANHGLALEEVTFEFAPTDPQVDSLVMRLRGEYRIVSAEEPCI